MAKEHTASHEHSKSAKEHEPAAGKRGVSQGDVGGGKDKDPNNFANDPSRAAAAGRKGGHESHKKS